MKPLKHDYEAVKSRVTQGEKLNDVLTDLDIPKGAYYSWRRYQPNPLTLRQHKGKKGTRKYTKKQTYEQISPPPAPPILSPEAHITLLYWSPTDIAALIKELRHG
jgi:hypothetical protein